MTVHSGMGFRSHHLTSAVAHCAGYSVLALSLAAALRWGRPLVSPPLSSSMFNSLFIAAGIASVWTVHSRAASLYPRCGAHLLVASTLLAVLTGAIAMGLDTITVPGDPIRLFYGPAAGLVVLYSAMSLLAAFMAWLWSKADDTE